MSQFQQGPQSPTYASERLAYAAQQLSLAKDAFDYYEDETAERDLAFWQKSYAEAYLAYTNPFGVSKTIS